VWLIPSCELNAPLTLRGFESMPCVAHRDCSVRRERSCAPARPFFMPRFIMAQRAFTSSRVGRTMTIRRWFHTRHGYASCIARSSDHGKADTEYSLWPRLHERCGYNML
jgi:hypothetical protein